MGTSSSNPGPKGKRAPVPPWHEEELKPSFPKPVPTKDIQKPLNPAKLPQSPNPGPHPQKSWSSPKRKIADFMKNSTKDNYSKMGSGYVKASGGSKSATSSARAGRRATAGIAGFFSAGVRDGFTKAAEEFGIGKLVGKDARTVAADIIERFSPSGGTLEEAAARNALIQTMKEFFKEIELEERGVEALDSLTPLDVQSLLELSIVNYLNERLQSELLNRVERKSISEKQANRTSKQIKKFIKGAVKLDLREVDVLKVDWKSPRGGEIISSLYRQAYEILGDE